MRVVGHGRGSNAARRLSPREPLFAEHLDVVRAAQLRERWEVESSEGQQRGGQIHHEQDRPRSRKSRSGAMAEGPPPEAHENE